MKKLLLTLVGIVCSLGMWASQTELISGVTLPNLPEGTYTVGTEVSHNGTNKAVVYDKNTAWAVIQAVAAGYGSPTAANFTWCNAYSGSDGAYSSTGATWDALAPFVGSAAYTTIGNAHYVNFARRGNVRKTDRTFAYRFTNARAVSAYVKSQGNKAGAGINLAVFQVTGEGTQTQVEIVNDYTQTAKAITVENLNEANTYVAYIYGDNNSNGELYEIAFKAPTTINISSIIAKSQVTTEKTWDFTPLTNTCALYTTLSGLGASDAYWGEMNSSNQIQSKQTASTDHALTIDGTVKVDATDGLLFNGGTFGFDFNQHRLRCFSSSGKIVIPNLLAGDQIVIVGARNSTSTSTRGFEFTNCDITEHKSADGASWTAVPTLTVTANGNVVINCVGGVNITSIEIVPGPGTGAAKLTLADNKEYAYDADFTGNVTLQRTFAADGWYSICLPFDLDDVSMFTKVAEFSQQVGDTYKFTTASSIVAGKPYIVKVDEALANPVFEEVTISKNVAADASADFKGVLNPTELVAGCAGIGTGTSINPLNAGTLKGFRGYFQSASASKVSSFFVDDVTASGAVETAKAIVNGKFMENGKIVIVKAGKKYNVAGIEK